MLKIRDLKVIYSLRNAEFAAVDGLSLDLARGARFGLVGESGSGKSTVLRAIMGLAPMSAGEILVDGQRVEGRRLQWLYRQVQLVFQDPYASLHPRQTIDRILAETLHLHGADHIDARIDKLLGQVGLGTKFRFRFPHELSGGQRQRVAIARALAARPSLLLLDEPTSALDVSVQAEILNLLSDIIEEQKLTMIMVSHDLPVVGHMCDRLAIMQRGKVVETLETWQLREGQVMQDYSRSLLAAAGIPTVQPKAAIADGPVQERA